MVLYLGMYLLVGIATFVGIVTMIVIDHFKIGERVSVDDFSAHSVSILFELPEFVVRSNKRDLDEEGNRLFPLYLAGFIVQWPLLIAKIACNISEYKRYVADLKKEKS